MESHGAASNPVADAEEWTVYDLFRRQVSLHGTSIACSQQHDRITYAQLDHASFRIMKSLQNHGFSAGDFVPILGSRCLEMVACFLAVSRLGACYVPVDLETWGRDRTRSVLDMINATTIVLAGALPSEVDYPQHILRVDRQFLLLDEPCSTDTPIAPYCSSSRLAYIVFTSGTTGKPKGVMVSNRSLVNYVSNGGPDTPFNLGVKSTDIVLLLFSVAFDGEYLLLLQSKKTDFMTSMYWCDL